MQMEERTPLDPLGWSDLEVTAQSEYLKII